jgi:hypothetical protein
MLKKLFYLSTILISMHSYAQVGINTNNPQGVLHINSTANNPTNTRTDDDVVVAANTGNVAIGHASPAVKLDVKTSGNSSSPVPGFKLVDGSQGEGKVLHSDANGVTSWRDVTLFNKNPVIGSFNWAAHTNIGNTGWNSISTISVPPGTHMIYIKIHVLNTPNNGFLRTYVGTRNLGRNNSNSNDNPLLGGTNFQPYIGKDFEMTQSFVYTNTEAHNVSLYFNLQSDSNAVRRSEYTYDRRTTFLGVNLIENYFMSMPAN